MSVPITLNDITRSVEVFCFIEWVELRIVGPRSNRAHMVGDHIYHDPDVEPVASVYQVLEVFGCTEIGVDGVDVFGPISMESMVDVGDYGGDPDGIGPQIFDVAKVVDDSLEATSAIIPNVARGLGAVTMSKPDELII